MVFTLRWFYDPAATKYSPDRRLEFLSVLFGMAFISFGSGD
ncbi:MAG TPA: hypothetical protein VK557_12420 [Pyrinomonadaceae bacterium]|nr:hypothetical protein [Pyrinomonadaceae bacterium]